MTKILIIDDDEMIRENTVEYLTEEGFEVYAACNGEEGLRCIEKHLPELIICDIAMPKLSGIQVYDIIQENRLLKKIPFLFFTASSPNDKHKTGLEIDTDHFMEKPFDFDTLKTKILLLLKSQKMKSERMKQ